MRDTLITGGSGFIGSHFHNALNQDRLINLDIVEPFFLYHSQYLRGDIRNSTDVELVLKNNNIKKIISLAAKHHDFGIGHDEYFDTNRLGTEVICNAASKFGVKEIVFYSSVAVYGNTNGISTELMEPKPDSPYGASKLAGEEVLQKWVKEDTTRKVLIIRPALVFGANNRANMYNLINQINSGFYFHIGKADNIKSIAYVENLVKATLFLKERMKPGVAVYNYADEPQLTTRIIGDTIAKALGKKIHLNIPKWLGIIVGLPFDLAIKLTGKNLPISSTRIKKLGTETHHSARKIFSEGFKSEYSTIEGLRKMVDWYLSMKK
jgi:GlcNAc-P-P-Und epimerase